MINLPNKPKILEEKENSGVFEVDACYPGYGITLGNAMRRALLSSLPGAAIIGIKVKGVAHEFSTIPHVMEDMVQIILNLKQVRFKVFAEHQAGDIFKATLKVKGEKEIKAADIKTSSELEVVNKKAHIATLADKKGELDMEIEIGVGLGYSPIEERKQGKLETGKVAIDAIFTPVKRVNYSVGHMRVGERTDYDKISFLIETDGTISPKNAFLKAARVLVDHFNILAQLGEKEVKTKREKIAEKEAEDKKKKIKSEAKKKSEAKEKAKQAESDLTKMKVSDLKISSRTATALEQSGVKTLAGLIRKSEEELQHMEGLGSKSVVEIKRAIGKFGFTLKQ